MLNIIYTSFIKFYIQLNLIKIYQNAEYANSKLEEYIYIFVDYNDYFKFFIF